MDRDNPTMEPIRAEEFFDNLKVLVRKECFKNIDDENALSVVIDSAESIYKFLSGGYICGVVYFPELYREFSYDDFRSITKDGLNFLNKLLKIVHGDLSDCDQYKNCFRYALKILYTIAGIDNKDTEKNDSYIVNKIEMSDHKNIMLRIFVDVDIVMKNLKQCDEIVDNVNKDLRQFFDIINKETGLIDKINSDNEYKTAVTSFDLNTLSYYAKLYNSECTEKLFEFKINFKLNRYVPRFRSINPDGVLLWTSNVPHTKLQRNEIWNNYNRYNQFRDNLMTYDRIINENNLIYPFIAINSYLTGVPFHFNIDDFRGQVSRYLHMIKMLKDKYIFMFEYIDANLKVIDMESYIGENLITSIKAGVK